MIAASPAIASGGGSVVLHEVANSGSNVLLFTLWREVLASVSMFVFASVCGGLQVRGASRVAQHLPRFCLGDRMAAPH